VIRKVNTSILELSKECIYVHSKAIRDMAFHPIEHNLLASVSLDKCIKLSDMVSNTVAATVVGKQYIKYVILLPFSTNSI